MGKGFQKFKRNSLMRALFKSALAGISFGLIVAGGALLASKIIGVDLSAWLKSVSGISLGVWVYVIIGCAVALLCGGITFLIVKKSDKKLAIELDNKFGLNEKVQTALAFAGESGGMYELQREDAEAHLAAIPRPKFGVKSLWRALAQNFSRIWQFFVIVPLAVAVAATAIIMPSAVVQGAGGPGEEEIPFTLSDAQIEDLNHLLVNVQDCELDEELKAYATKYIRQLMVNLTVAEWKSEMEAVVGSTMRRVNSLFTGAVSYKKVANSLAKYNQMDFAMIIAVGAQAYRHYSLIDYTQVEALLSEGVEKVQEDIYEMVTDRFALFQKNMEKNAQATAPGTGNGAGNGAEDGAEDGAEEAPAQDDKNTPVEVAMAIMTAQVGTGDGLYGVVMNLASSLAQWRAGIIPDPSSTFYYGAARELAAQAYIIAVERYICYNIADIFGVRAPDDPEFKPHAGSSSSGEDGDDKKGTQGGYGDGSLKGGSDDLIYNPNTGQYEKYIDILNEYYAIVEAMLREGTLNEEQINVIRNYFEILYGPSAA